MSPLSPFGPRRVSCLVAAVLDLISFRHGVHTVPFSLCNSSHCCSLHELESCSLGETVSPWCTVRKDSTNPVDYVFHFVTTYVACGIQTTFSLNWMPSPFIWTSSSHFKMDLISFWHSHFLLCFSSISISGKCSIIWISHVAVGKTGFWCFSKFSLSSKKL